MNDEKMNQILAKHAGKGPTHWAVMRDDYGEGFGRVLLDYQKRWPERIIIHRPYDMSSSPMVEVTRAG